MSSSNDLISRHRGETATELLNAAALGPERDVLQILLSTGVIFTNAQAAKVAKKIAALSTLSPPADAPSADKERAREIAEEIMSPAIGKVKPEVWNEMADRIAAALESARTEK